MKNLLIVLLICMSMSSFGQNKTKELPYYQVPEYSEAFTAGTMAARMVDALGFRFFWATNNLTEKDLQYRLNKEGRSTSETIDHIYDLSFIVLNSTLKQPNSKADKTNLSYKEKRTQTLHNLKTAADILRESKDISQYKIIFGDRKIPFWNQVNGPIADSIWHCGQIAVFRRATENPINSKVNHFTGKVSN